MNAHQPPNDAWAFGVNRAADVPAMKRDLSRSLFPIETGDSIVESAISYASNGWSVFPVPIGTKRSHKSAANSDGRKWGQTKDADEIRRDFKKWPDANAGVVCGEVSGIFVVEADTKDGHDVDGIASLAALEVEHGVLPPTRQAMSPSGSVHYYFNHPGFKVKNSASEIAPGVDVRGDGGMVVAPPSVKPGRGVYIWLNNLPIADCPQWLLNRIIAGKETPADPEPAPSITKQAIALVRPPADYFVEHGARSSNQGDGYIEAALRGEYDDVVSLSNGRNHQLNISAVKLGHYVAGGVLDEKCVIDTLMDACKANALIAHTGEAQCLATIKSGLTKGKTEPKGIPERLVSGHVSAGEVDNVVQLPGTNKPAQSQAMALTFFDDVESFTKKEWLLKGAIAKGETSLWIAPPGRLKSALMMDISICVASGADWRGYKSKQKCGVIYFALERGDLVKRRTAAHKKRERLTGLPIAIAPGIINLMDPRCVSIIVETIRDAEKRFGCSVGFAAFDTLAKGVAAGGGDENQAKDLGAALANLRRAQELTGAHIAIISHTGKDEKRGARGSNSQDGDVDVVVQISGDGPIKVATVTKANDQEEGVLTRFKGEISVLGDDDDGDEITTMIISVDDCGSADGKSKEKAPLGATQRRAMDLLIKAINDDGRAPPASAPHGVVKVVTLDAWRECSKKGALSDGGDDANRTAFNRTKTELANKGRIGIENGLVWVAYD
jgi:hypothetical protein